MSVKAVVDPRRASPRRGAAAMVAGAFAVQGLGYAAVVTALPAVKDRIGLDDAVIAGILLGVCVAAALGSMLADVVAVRADSRVALCCGLFAQALALVGMSLAGDLLGLVAAVTLYGIGIGMVDAACTMQGVALQALTGRVVMGRLYAATTIGGIVGALSASGAARIGISAFAVLVAVAAVQASVAVAGRVLLVRGGAPGPAGPAGSSGPAAAHGPRIRMPRAALCAIGALVLVSFAVDAAVSSWSAVYLADGLDASDAQAPVGYAVYLAVVLGGRLAVDVASVRWGRRRLALLAVAAGVAGCALVALGGSLLLAVLGLGLAGLVAGLLLPVAFVRSGELLPERRDEVIARVNVFSYVGAVLGAVAPGLLGGGAAIRFGFVAPALALVLVLPVVLRLPRGPAEAVEAVDPADRPA